MSIRKKKKGWIKKSFVDNEKNANDKENKNKIILSGMKNMNNKNINNLNNYNLNIINEEESNRKIMNTNIKIIYFIIMKKKKKKKVVIIFGI